MAKREIKTIFALDGEAKYKDAIKSINKEQSLLRAETKALTTQFELTGEEQKALAVKAESLTKQIELQKRKVDEAKNAVEQSTKIYGENSNQTQEYKIQVARAETALNRLQGQLVETNKQIALNESNLKKAGDAAEKAGKKMQDIGGKMDKAGSALTVGLTAPIVAAAGYATKAATDFESAFAGVRKTVDATEEQLNELETGIRDMSKELPSSANEIAAVAESAGQLGIQTDNILGFSKAMIDLGNATNMSANEAASALAQFANITQMSQKDFDRLGSVIVDLGNNSATTEKDIVNMGMRLAGAGKQVGMTEAQIMAISAALASVGIEAEAGGSAFSKVMVNMQLAASKGGKDLDNFAKVAGMSSSEFAKAYKENAAGALTAFVSGLGKLKESGGDAIGTLDDMGITEVRMRDALLRSAGAGDVLSESIDRASKAWDENNALTKEAEQRYGTTESKMKIAKNEIDDAAITIGKNLLPVVADLAGGLADAAQAFGSMDPAAQKAVIALLGVVAGIGPVLKVTGNLTSGIGKASSAIGKFAQKLAEKKAAEVASTAATEGLSGAIGGAGGLTSLINPATAAVVAATTALGLLAAAAYKADEDTRKFNDAVASSAEGAAEFVDGISSAKSALDGFDDSSVWTTENQEKLKKKVDEAQSGITEITSLAVEQRRTMTEKEYERLQKLIDQLGAFADGQIEAYQQKNRIVQSMAENEQNMTEQRAQELIKAAEENREEIIRIADAQRIKEYQIADEIRQNANKLREQGKDEQAAIEDARAAEMMAKADKDYSQVMSAENKKTADVIKAVQERYMQQNQAEIDHMKRTKEIYDELDRLDKERQERVDKVMNDTTKTLEERGKAAYHIRREYAGKEKELNDELKGLWDDRTEEVAGAMAGMAGVIEFYGGKQSDEAKKASDGIIAAYDNLPKKSKETITNAMQSMVDTLKGKAQGLWNAASNMAGGFLKAVKDKLGIKSPSREMRLIAENITKTTADTISSTSGKVKKSAADMAEGVLEEAQRMSVASEFAKFVTGSRQAVSFATAAVKSTAQSITAPTTKQNKGGDLIIPISVNGEFVGEARLTSAELARQEKMRDRTVGVEI